MSNPKDSASAEVDPSEGAIDEGAEEQQNSQASEAEGQESATLEVDPSEGPTE